MKKFLSKSLTIMVVAIAALSMGVNVKAAPQNNSNKDKMQTENNATEIPGPVVEIKTTLGDITIKLYDDTPLHRDNFLKLVKDGFYEGLLFHRVINQFMVQTGDPDSKDAPAGKMLGSGNPGYTVEAEILYPKHYHKYGALAAARTGDAYNPERRSSGSQFYIVTGTKVQPAQVEMAVQRGVNAQRQALFRKLASGYNESINKMMADKDEEGLKALQEKLMAEVMEAYPDVPVDRKMIDDYAEVGGAPHLDGQYTVFGEVLKGMDVVEKIQSAETDSNDRPKEDIKILSVKVIE